MVAIQKVMLFNLNRRILSPNRSSEQKSESSLRSSRMPSNFSNHANSLELKQFAIHQTFLSKFDSAVRYAGCLLIGTPYLQLQSRFRKLLWQYCSKCALRSDIVVGNGFLISLKNSVYFSQYLGSVDLHKLIQQHSCNFEHGLPSLIARRRNAKSLAHGRI